MSGEKIQAVLDCQADLIKAIDTQNATAIIHASEALAGAVAALRNSDDWPRDPLTADRLRNALRENRAAAMQINLLAHWTRRKIDRLSELRSQHGPQNPYKTL